MVRQAHHERTLVDFGKALLLCYGVGDTLVGEPPFPGFPCPVADIFAFGPCQD